MLLIVYGTAQLQKADVTLGVKAFLEWHEEFYMEILLDEDIGGRLST